MPRDARPSTASGPVEKLRSAYRAVGFAGLTLTMGTGVAAGLAAAPARRRPLVRDAVTRAWSRGLLRLFSVDVEVHGAAPGPRGVGRGKGRVVVANHRSIIDIAILLDLFGGVVLSRDDLLRWPVIGYAARSAGTIFVNRGDKASGASAVQAMVDRLDLDDTINLFPEGTTYVDDEVRPFKAGGFAAAARAKTPVVPVGIAYPVDSRAGYGGETFVQHLANLAAETHTKATVVVGEPVAPNEGEDFDAFKERCRAVVARLVEEARALQHGA